MMIKKIKMFPFLFMFFLFSFNVNSQNKVDAKWKEINGTLMPIPPHAHPRLYLRSNNIPKLKERMSDPALKEVWDDLIEMQKDWDPKDIPEEKGWRFYVQQKGLTVRAEMNAMQYLVTKDKLLGRNAITSILDTLNNSSWPEVHDIARAAGRMMVSGAIVYDWCYDLLDEKEKEQFIDAFVRLAKMLECDYPPLKQGSITGHSSEWMIMRDMLSAGIAIYDEFPEMYNLAAGRFFKELLPARNWFYPSHAYHQGSSYDNVRLSSDLFPLWIFDRMGAGNVYNPSQQFVLYNFIYKRRPDGQVLPGGDVNYSRKKSKALGLPAMLAASYYKDEYINYEFHKKTSIDSRSKIFDFLWRDTKLGTRKPDDLPLTKYFGFPHGWMIARTGWGRESVIAEMKINVYNFVNHQHQDAGTFQIYYKGPLTIDSGTYQGSSGGNMGYNSPHNKNYFKRTIAHNSLLVYDPDEEFKAMGYGGKNKTPFVDNDGGQRLPGNEWQSPGTLKELLNGDFKTGKILAHGVGPDYLFPEYTYLKGDITEAYSDKVDEVKRTFTFLNFKDDKIPAALIVFDKVVSSNPNFKKYWLLHSMEEPKVNGNEIIIARTKNGDSGKLINTSFLPKPENSEITTIGGKGKEFWVFGKNYENEPRPGDDKEGERGAWRIQISPKEKTKEDYFLNVMQVMDNNSNKKFEIDFIEDEDVIGVQISDRVVTFSKNARTLNKPFSFTVKGKGKFKIIVTDLLPGNWQVIKDGKLLIPAIPVRSDDGVLYFEGAGGIYKFLR